MPEGGVTFFTDENVSQYATRMLDHFDRRNKLRSFLECFPAGTPDEQWLPAVSTWTPKPTIVCGDGRILRNKAQRVVLRKCDLMFVHLAPGWTNLAWDEYAWKLVKVWPDIVSDVLRARKATVFEVSPKTLKIEHISSVSEL